MRPSQPAGLACLAYIAGRDNRNNMDEMNRRALASGGSCWLVSGVDDDRATATTRSAAPMICNKPLHRIAVLVIGNTPFLMGTLALFGNGYIELYCLFLDRALWHISACLLWQHRLHQRDQRRPIAKGA